MDQVTEIREKVDIVTLISEFLPLKKLGRNFKTTCPFHSEKSPSFVVSAERQIWHCFGCGKGGDAFSFLMEYENLEFVEALRILAKRVGIELVSQSGANNVTSKKEEIYKINRLTAEYYHYILMNHVVGKQALAYLTKERKLDEKVIKTFQLGFSPKNGNALVSYLLTKKKYKQDDVIDAGLTVMRAGRLSDFFTNRIMFPLSDHRDNIIGFSGRIYGENTSGMGKYINTRDTVAYHKSEVFFGLNIAKTEIKKEQNALIMEGEFDVISAYSQGLSNAVAIKGTALTQQQVDLLARFTPKVSLCFDQDSAGQQALIKSIPSIEKKGLSAVVVVSPDGKDPDESLQTNAFAYKQAVKHAVGIYDYLIDQTIKKFGKAADGKKQVSEIVLPLLELIENEIVKEHYFRLLATALDSSYESILKQFEKTKSKELPKDIVQKELTRKTRDELLEEYLLSLLIQASNPMEAIKTAVAILQTVIPKDRAYQKILHHVMLHVSTKNHFDTKQFAHGLPEELLKTYDTCYLYPLPKFESEESSLKEVKKTAENLRNEYIKIQMKTLTEKLREKKNIADEDTKELVQLQEQFSLLSKKLGDQS